MRRLATALKPQVVFAESNGSGFFDLDPAAVVCAHQSLAISLLDDGSNARVAQVDANVSFLTTAAADVQLEIMRSDNAGSAVSNCRACRAARRRGTSPTSVAR